ncbi:hypothetical protein KI387_030452, partial [Taxus chinensis]
NNLLYPKEDKENKVLLYVCRNCNHEEVANNNCVYRKKIHHAANEFTMVLDDVTLDPTLPRTQSVKCAACNDGEVVFFQRAIACLLESNANIIFYPTFRVSLQNPSSRIRWKPMLKACDKVSDYSKALCDSICFIS